MNSFVIPRIRKMKPYMPPLEGRRKYQGVLCDFNERMIPASPKVAAAIREFARKNEMQIYPEYGETLVRKIATYAKVKPEEVMVTNGSDQGIDLIFRTFTTGERSGVPPGFGGEGKGVRGRAKAKLTRSAKRGAIAGDTVVIPSPSFAMFYQCAGCMGNKILEPSYKLPDLSYPMSEVLEAIENGAKLVIICNPNNPTGTLLSPENIEIILKKALKKSCLVYVDEAYYEFSGITASSLISKYPNLILTRTFSKAFGLAALRVGYVVSQAKNLAELQKIRGPYDVNMVGYAAACAALDDRAETEAYAREVMGKAKPLVEEFFRSKNILFFPSGSNFLLFKPKKASSVYKILKDKNFLVRPRSGPNIEGTLRLTIGTVSQMKKFISIYQNL